MTSHDHIAEAVRDLCRTAAGADEIAQVVFKAIDAGSLKRDEAWDAVPKLEAAIVGHRERIAYLEELNRRLERYAAFSADGTPVGGSKHGVFVQCHNCGECHLMTMEKYEQLQRETHERNGRIDL